MSAWWEPQTAGIIGAGIGVLGGIAGSLLGILAPKGKAKTFVLGMQIGLAGLGVVSLITGLVAIFMDQPYHVYYPLLLCGVVLPSVMLALLPVTLRSYRQAEQRKLDAESLRRG